MLVRLGSFAAAAALLISLVGPATSMAQPEMTGTLIGTILCGVGDQGTTTPDALVTIEGMDLSTHSDKTGRFTLVVPAMEPLTINAMTGPEELVPAVLPDVMVHPGETLDVGPLNLALCPPPAPLLPSESGPNDMQESTREELDNQGGGD